LFKKVETGMEKPHFMKSSKKAIKAPPTKYSTYPTRDAALLALFKATDWNAGEYLSIFPTKAGRFYFTLNETESFSIAEELNKEGIEYYRVCDDGRDEELEKKLEK